MAYFYKKHAQSGQKTCTFGQVNTFITRHQNSERILKALRTVKNALGNISKNSNPQMLHKRLARRASSLVALATHLALLEYRKVLS